MTENLSTTSNKAPSFDDSIHSRPYIEALVNHWKLIIGLAFVAAVDAFVVRSLLPAEFTAEADVPLLNVRWTLKELLTLRVPPAINSTIKGHQALTSRFFAQ
jgi:uncharacterized protein involved in exopolysaccharide biosynthesis